MKGRPLSYITKLVIAFSLLWNLPMHAAGSMPQIKFAHQRLDAVQSEQRNRIEIIVSSVQLINEVRCYFKTDLDTQWVFSIAAFTGLNRYSCMLPVLDKAAKLLVYRFVAINVKEQVVRSQINNVPILQQKHGSSSIDNLSPIIIYDELWGNYQPWVHDSQTTLAAVYDERLRYGLIAKLYASEQIPQWLGIKAGYFGGFEYNHERDVLFPVKGFAAGLGSDYLGLGISGQVVADHGVTQGAVAEFDIQGDDWAGHFQTTGFNNRVNLTADINQSGSSVTLITSKSGLAHHFVGTINSSGHMLLFDQFDGEDWTTHLGPASSTSVNIYDFVRKPSLFDPNPPLNSVLLSRELLSFDLSGVLLLLLD